jgi:hypothetical protein
MHAEKASIIRIPIIFFLFCFDLIFKEERVNCSFK